MKISLIANSIGLSCKLGIIGSKCVVQQTVKKELHQETGILTLKVNDSIIHSTDILKCCLGVFGIIVSKLRPHETCAIF